MMSLGGNSIVKKLKILLEHDNYKLEEELRGRFYFTSIDFTDGGAAYRRFWNKYERPPTEEYQQYIIDRRDLLVPQNIREVKGSFFTPTIWVEKSQEYLEKVFGENWQDEYYVWDCAAGTGNLLAGLTNKDNVWASDIDAGNINTIRALIGGGLNLLPDHAFQFDFLNDDVEKLPEALRKILCDPEKRGKLIVYINPPYAEATNARTVTGTGKNRSKVSKGHIARREYNDTLGRAANELYALFMMRIADIVSGAYLAVFSTVKYINSSNFAKFRENFSAQFQKGFICPSNTFDNVSGKFPIIFLIWKLAYRGYEFKFPESVTLDVFDAEGNRSPKKKGYYNKQKYINAWIKEFDTSANGVIGFMGNYAPDFQNAHQPYITVNKGFHHINYFGFHKKNIFEGSIYFAVRLCIEPVWLTNQDQFLYPNDGYKNDSGFKTDCLIFVLFHSKNRISCKDGANHWIPFTAEETGAREKFERNFMSSFLKGKAFSEEARAVLSAGKALWKYYHGKTISANASFYAMKNSNAVSVNASFYDIREFFQGRKENGKMNAKSPDQVYAGLIKALRDALKILAKKIEPKVYEYGFLKE
jgi:hypothetical protein